MHDRNMNMLAFLLCVHVFFSITYALNDYKIVMKRVEVIAVNPEMVECDAFMSRIDRYTVATNFVATIKRDIPSHYKILIKCYEFLNNEYRPFAIHFERSLCSFIENEYKSIFYPDLVRLGANVPKPKCPILKGNYSVYNYIPSIENIPMGLPFKNLMVDIKMLNRTNVEANLRVYALLDRDAAIRERYS